MFGYPFHRVECFTALSYLLDKLGFTVELASA
jgi:hypothetical protein